ncbi:DUF6314 family protein [Histidinibacterium aquaticum]|uniref:DUF6314 domain-containing protein n=1 Tax=Histidinibacterium aquaticum TaxID=2613962 RepID=A0A5J5GP04_9RHOB|nr:DUF6314 family protein [Histidinibacterium aquaticum]KAA9009264.1 hypothetical protein F3S47_08415 [Histidinibacterium aquaticum]
MDVLSAFEDRWSLSRRVEDRRAGALLALEGEALLTRDGEGLRYEESGLWTEGPYTGLKASRVYLWRATGEEIAVFFSDGRPFHDFRPGEAGQAQAGHDCAPDRYDVLYRFELPHLWKSVWTVAGPAKDYTATTLYRRA